MWYRSRARCRGVNEVGLARGRWPACVLSVPPRVGCGSVCLSPRRRVRQSLRTNNECYALFRLLTVCSLRPEACCEVFSGDVSVADPMARIQEGANGLSGVNSIASLGKARKSQINGNLVNPARDCPSPTMNGFP